MIGSFECSEVVGMRANVIADPPSADKVGPDCRCTDLVEAARAGEAATVRGDR
ncbi:MAG: hypothetical protein WCC64_19590 [Aliidongia sp.]